MPFSESDRQFLDGVDFEPSENVDQSAEWDSEIDTSDMDESSIANSPVALAGFYHFKVVKVQRKFELLTDDGKEQTPHVHFVMSVQHSAPGQSPEGSIHNHWLYVAGKGGQKVHPVVLQSLQAFCVGLGLLKFVPSKTKPGKTDLVLASNESPNWKPSQIPWESAVGVHCVCPIVTEKARDGREPRLVIPYGRAYHPNSKDVAHVPKNIKVLTDAGYKIDTPQGSSKPATRLTTPTTPAPAPKTAAKPELVGSTAAGSDQQWSMNDL